MRVLDFIIGALAGALLIVCALYFIDHQRKESPTPSPSPTISIDSPSPSPLTSQSPTNAPTPTLSPFTSTDLQLAAPRINELIASPLTISGKAVGSWYFEAQFPIKILDANGKEVGHATARTQNDWMTSELVPFTAEINFGSPTTDTGTLVLSKDNPSGLPVNDKSASVPVRFR